MLPHHLTGCARDAYHARMATEATEGEVLALLGRGVLRCPTRVGRRRVEDLKAVFGGLPALQPSPS